MSAEKPSFAEAALFGGSRLVLCDDVCVCVMGALLSMRCPGDHLEYLLVRQRVLLPKTLISLKPEMRYHLVDCTPPTVRKT